MLAQHKHSLNPSRRDRRCCMCRLVSHLQRKASSTCDQVFKPHPLSKSWNTSLYGEITLDNSTQNFDNSPSTQSTLTLLLPAGHSDVTTTQRRQAVNFGEVISLLRKEITFIGKGRYCNIDCTWLLHCRLSAVVLAGLNHLSLRGPGSARAHDASKCPRTVQPGLTMNLFRHRTPVLPGRRSTYPTLPACLQLHNHNPVNRR